MKRLRKITFSRNCSPVTVGGRPGRRAAISSRSGASRYSSQSMRMTQSVVGAAAASPHCSWSAGFFHARCITSAPSPAASVGVASVEKLSITTIRCATGQMRVMQRSIWTASLNARMMTVIDGLSSVADRILTASRPARQPHRYSRAIPHWPRRTDKLP